MTWAEHIDKLGEKFQELRENGWESHFRSANPALQAHILTRYDELTLELVDGIQGLLLPMIENQVYIRKVWPHIDKRLYPDMHLGLFETVKTALSVEIQSLPSFYMQLLEILDKLKGYCLLLKQDINAAFQSYPRLRRDRKFRQINLQLQRAQEGFSWLLNKSKMLSRLIGEGQVSTAMEMVLGSPAGKAEIMELLETASFSDQEKDLLWELLEEAK